MWTPRQRLRPWPILLLWVLLIVYCEYISPDRTISRCKWPGTVPQSTRIALVADPQLIDAHTYPGRPWFFEWLTEIITDRYLAKNWRFIQRNLDPDATIFLGDLFDGGREWETPAWIEEYNRFHSIFPQPLNKKTVMSLPGNHDIGFGNTIVPKALHRFKAWFGPTSRVVDIGGHNMVLLDTISMSNTQDPLIYEPHFDFLHNLPIEESETPQPVYLCSHVPLFRPPGSNCGKYRESARDLPYEKGDQYLTQVTPALTQEILETLQPVAIFSGDDHDACHVIHNYTVNGEIRQAHEFTVKSTSMAMGISAPGIQLLTLNPDGFETAICFQGHPFKPFAWYGAAAVATVVYLLRASTSLTSVLPIAELKEKKMKAPKGTLHNVAKDCALVFGVFLIAQWYIGRWIYAGL